MNRILAILATIGLTIALLAWPSSAEAVTYVSIRTISTKTVAPGAKAVIKPSYTVRSNVKVSSARLTVRRGTVYLAKNATSASLPVGAYSVTVTVKYRVKSGGTYGALRTALKAQSLTVKLATPVVEPPVEPSVVTPPVVEPPVVEPPSTVVAPPSSPCGTLTTRKADGSEWTCTFSDEFSGDSLDTSKWRVQQTAHDGVHTGPECWVDSPNNIAVANGTLRLTTREEAEPFTCKSPYGDYTSKYTGASVNTWGNFSQTYGRFEIRAKFPDVKVAGTHGALWLYPESTAEYGYANSASGEIDIAEVYSVYPDRAIPYLHYNSAQGDNTVTAWSCLLDPSKFHTYTAEWTPRSIKISYDGQVCQEHLLNPLTSAPFDRPFVAVLTQTLGATGTTNEYIPGTTPLPATMDVDYVRIWS